MWVVDGNNSAKRMASIGERDIGDRRIFDSSDYFLPSDYVDQFAHEVPAPTTIPGNEDFDVEEDAEDAEDVTTPDPSQSPSCGEWKAAASDKKKKMWGIFSETGIFASACRHGFIMWLADMIRSGEL
jgi:Kyakuja-Dileera-Zisupton transposase